MILTVAEEGSRPRRRARRCSRCATSTAFAGRRGPVFAAAGVSFSLAEGETKGLVGESGSGKSVTLRSLIGPRARARPGDRRRGASGTAVTCSQQYDGAPRASGSPATIGEELFGEAAIEPDRHLRGRRAEPVLLVRADLAARPLVGVGSASLQDLVGPEPLLVRNCTRAGTKYHDLNANGNQD